MKVKRVARKQRRKRRRQDWKPAIGILQVKIPKRYACCVCLSVSCDWGRETFTESELPPLSSCFIWPTFSMSTTSRNWPCFPYLKSCMERQTILKNCVFMVLWLQAAIGEKRGVSQQQNMDKSSTQKASKIKAPSVASSEILGDLICSKKGKKNKKAQSQEEEVVTRAAERTAAAVGEDHANISHHALLCACNRIQASPMLKAHHCEVQRKALSKLQAHLGP